MPFVTAPLAPPPLWRSPRRPMLLHRAVASSLNFLATVVVKV
ncbi:hypothetical protein [Streptomyces sp. E5N91]|nr:hypothetical protein [Streptomyces sp. E5N91]